MDLSWRFMQRRDHDADKGRAQPPARPCATRDRGHCSFAYCAPRLPPSAPAVHLVVYRAGPICLSFAPRQSSVPPLAGASQISRPVPTRRKGASASIFLFQADERVKSVHAAEKPFPVPSSTKVPNDPSPPTSTATGTVKGANPPLVPPSGASVTRLKRGRGHASFPSLLQKKETNRLRVLSLTGWPLGAMHHHSKAGGGRSMPAPAGCYPYWRRRRATPS